MKYQSNSGQIGVSAILIITRVIDNKDDSITIFRPQLSAMWQCLSEQPFPEANTDDIVDKILEEQLLIEYKKNNSNIITAVRLKNKVHPQ